MDQDRVKSICRLGGGIATCSFLLMGLGGWECAKSPGNEGFRAILDARRASGTIIAMGDNCEGFAMPHKEVAP